MNNKIIAGIDEVARGCLFGRVYCSVAIWRPEIDLNIILKIKLIKKLLKIARN